MPLTAPASFKRVHARGSRVQNAFCRARLGVRCTHLGVCFERYRALHRVGRVLHHLDSQPHAAPRAQHRAAGPARRARGACRIRSGPGVLSRSASGRARCEREPVGFRQAQPERRIRGVPSHDLPSGGQLSRGGRWAQVITAAPVSRSRYLLEGRQGTARVAVREALEVPDFRPHRPCPRARALSLRRCPHRVPHAREAAREREVRGGGTRRVQLARRGGTRRVQLVRRGGGG